MFLKVFGSCKYVRYHVIARSQIFLNRYISTLKSVSKFLKSNFYSIFELLMWYCMSFIVILNLSSLSDMHWKVNYPNKTILTTNYYVNINM